MFPKIAKKSLTVSFYIMNYQVVHMSVEVLEKGSTYHHLILRKIFNKI